MSWPRARIARLLRDDKVILYGFEPFAVNPSMAQEPGVYRLESKDAADGDDGWERMQVWEVNGPSRFDASISPTFTVTIS